MDINQTKTIIKSFPKRSIMLHAKHGVGKSSIVKQCAEELGIDFKDVRLSQCEVGDIKGLPYRDTDDQGNHSVKFAKPEWYPTEEGSSGILFFDELNRASKEVLQAVFEICLDRRLDGNDLPDKWIIVSAVNSEDDYDVVDLDPALQDRFFHIDFEPSVSDWISWASNNGVHKAILQFVSRNKELLDPPMNNLESGEVYPSRRSWVAFNEFIKSLNLINGNNDEMLVLTAKGWLGRTVAIMFQKYVSSEFNILEAKDVIDNLEDNKADVEASCSDIEIISLLAKSVVDECNTRRANKFGDKQKENLFNFFMMLPNDVASDAWVGIISGVKTKKLAISWKSNPEFAERLTEIYLS